MTDTTRKPLDEATLKAQRESWARGMAPCEHGVADWEECAECRNAVTARKEAKAAFDPAADMAKRLRDAYGRWNEPSSEALPEGAGVMLEAADLLEAVARERDETRAEAAEASLAEALTEALKTLEPFALVAEYDIGDDETDNDFFRPMERHNRAPRLKVGHLRAALRVFKGSDK